MNMAQDKDIMKYYCHHGYVRQMDDIFIIFVCLTVASIYIPPIDVFVNWWQATHWLGYLCVIFLIWNSVNHYWGTYWQLTDESLNYYFSFMRVKHIALADITGITVLAQQDSSQKLTIFCGTQGHDINKPKAIIDSKYCLDFSILVQRLKNKLPDFMQGDVHESRQEIEHYQQKNRKVSLIIWALFWIIIAVKLCWQRVYVPWDIKFLLLAALLIVLVLTCIHISLKLKATDKKLMAIKTAFINNQYVILPVLICYLVINIYLYVG